MKGGIHVLKVGGITLMGAYSQLRIANNCHFTQVKRVLILEFLL